MKSDLFVPSRQASGVSSQASIVVSFVLCIACSVNRHLWCLVSNAGAVY